MTVEDRLREMGVGERETHEVAEVLVRVVPFGRPIVLTDDVIAAVRAGDLALVSSLLAEEVEPQPDEIEALDEAARMDDGTRLTADEVRRELRLI